MSKSLRNLGEQFGVGIDLSASRIQKNINTLNGTFSELPEWARTGLWVTTTRVAGMAPAPGSAGIMVGPSTFSEFGEVGFPFMSEWNAPGFFISGTHPAPSGSGYPTNEHRNKASFQRGVVPGTYGGNPYPDGVTGGNFAWESSFIVGNQPQILKEVAVSLQTDSNTFYYTNDFHYGPIPPPDSGRTPNGWINDVSLNVYIDDDAEPEDRRRTSVVLSARDFTVDRFLISTAPSDTMYPLYTDEGNACKGVLLRFKSTDAVLPANCRWRVVMTIPDYNGGEQPWEDYPWMRQAWSLNIKTLERLSI